jgi:hypothetical protein
VLAGEVIAHVGATPYVEIGNALLVVLASTLLAFVRLGARHRQ